MIISHSYFSRLMGTRGTPIPAEKDDVTDKVCISVLGVAGAHQVLLDLSRCVLLQPTTFDYLKRCPALLYLDLSYTRVLDLSPIRTCTMLRAFNGAGLKLSNDTGYDALRDLPQLELLILRGSNISNGGRLKASSILRSLDISFTRIDSIEFLKDMKRLEELVMESLSLFTRGNAVANYLKVLQGLPSLRCINVLGTELASTAHQPALLSIHKDVHIENKPRHEIFFAAVAGNDIKKVEDCLGAGVDINTRCDTWCEAIIAHHVEILLRASERFYENDTVAQRGYQMIPFFNFHKESKERPCAIHIALFFGYIEMTKTLVHHGVSHNVPVYVNYPVKERPGGGTSGKGNQGNQAQEGQTAAALTAATLKQNTGTAGGGAGGGGGELVETDNLISVLFEHEMYHEMAVREELKKHHFRMTKPPDMRNEGKGRFRVRNLAQRQCRYLDLALMPHGDVDDNGSIPGSILGSFANIGSVHNGGASMVTIGSTGAGDVGVARGIQVAEANAARAVSAEEEMRDAQQGQGLGLAPGQGLGIAPGQGPASDVDKHLPPMTDALDTLLQGGNNNDGEDNEPALQDDDDDNKNDDDEYDENGKKKKKMKDRDIIQGVLPMDDRTKRWRSHYLVQRLIGTGTAVVPTSHTQAPSDGEQGLDHRRRSTSKRQGLGRKKDTPTVVIMGGRNFWGEGKRITRQLELSKLTGHHDDGTEGAGKETDQPYMHRALAMSSEQVAAALARDGWDLTRPATSPTLHRPPSPHRPTSPSAHPDDGYLTHTERPYSPPYYNPYDNADPVDEEMSLPVTERLALFKRVLHKYFADDGRLQETEEEMMRRER